MGSQTRKLRARGAIDSSSDLTKTARVGRTRKRGRSKWKRPAIKLISPSPTAWCVFDDVVRQSDEWTRTILAEQPPVVVELPAEPPLRLPAPEPAVIARNEPLERLRALQVADPELMTAAMASLAPVPGIHQLAAAAVEREEEIRQAAAHRGDGRSGARRRQRRASRGGRPSRRPMGRDTPETADAFPATRSFGDRRPGRLGWRRAAAGVAMSALICPRCGAQLRCVDSSGVWFRCHMEHAFDLSENPEAQRQAAGLRALSASNAAAIRGSR